MGLKCTIDQERGGSCTAFDGKLNDGSNAWEKLESIIEEIPCDSCREDGKSDLSGMHDITNLSIGEITKPFDESNLKKYVQKTVTVWNDCVNRGACQGEKHEIL